MCVTVCVCQCVWVCGDWEWNTHMAANYRWAASQTWSSWQAHTHTDRQIEREREKKRGSTRSLSYCNHAKFWIRERPIRWGTLAPDKTTPVSFCPCRNYEAARLWLQHAQCAFHTVAFAVDAKEPFAFSSWSTVTYIHIRWHSFGARCRPLTFTIQSCMAKVKVWLWSGWKRGGVWQASIGGAVQRGRSILCANMSLLALSYSTTSNTSVHLGAVQCSFMRLAFFFSLDLTLNARTIRRSASPMPSGGPCPVSCYTAIVNILLDGREVPFTVTLSGYLWGKHQSESRYTMRRLFCVNLPRLEMPNYSGM